MRAICDEDFGLFQHLYIEQIPQTAFDKLTKFIQKNDYTCILCCEPKIETKDNCHRFALANHLTNQGILKEDEIIHLTMDDFG